jgi:hypothetical protein
MEYSYDNFAEDTRDHIYRARTAPMSDAATLCIIRLESLLDALEDRGTPKFKLPRLGRFDKSDLKPVQYHYTTTPSGS